MSQNLEPIIIIVNSSYSSHTHHLTVDKKYRRPSIIAYAMSQVPGTVNEITDNDIFDQPWKYTGYKKYAWFLASDDDFLIFRRFGTLNARILLLLQDEICVAEAKLKSLDEEYSQKTAPRQHNGSFRKESVQQTERKTLLLEIKEKLKEYSTLWADQDTSEH